MLMGSQCMFHLLLVVSLCLSLCSHDGTWCRLSCSHVPCSIYNSGEVAFWRMVGHRKFEELKIAASLQGLMLEVNGG